MYWILLVFVGYGVVYRITRKKSSGQKKVLYLSSFLVFLTSILYLFEWLYDKTICFSLGALLFLFGGLGLTHLIQVKGKNQNFHSYPIAIFTLFYLNFIVINKDAVSVIILNNILFLSVSILSFLYATYGYWCLIKNAMHKTLRPFVSFYIVVLYCISISFLIVRFSSVSLIEHLNFMFLLLSFGLLIGAFFYEMSLLIYFRYRAPTKMIAANLEQNANRLFQEILLDISLPQSERVRRLSREFKTIPFPANPSDAFTVFEIDMKKKITEISQSITEQLIETRLFLNPTLNLEQLGEILQFSKTDLIAFFKASHAATYKQYINRLKVEYAVLLIREREENYTVEELSLLCGFNTRLSFYRAFVNVFGFAPSEILS
ncbi:helix-turn-helix domain-containing protein [Myroides odoratus]|uniref:helix-turn-helix domain-containing protein n=1 Tax=Myroides odoratus TaxID=256 RepID=UPI0039AF5D77